MVAASYERYVHVARITLETASPLSVTSGVAERGFDTALVCDANGLPAIPGAALAGVLRHLYAERCDGVRTDGATPLADALFGYAEGGQQQASRVEVSWGAVHDAYDRPIDEYLTPREWNARLPGSDAQRGAYARHLRGVVLEPVTRDHVRIDERGVAYTEGAQGMKFDRALLPPGHRFTFELKLRTQAAATQEWTTLLGLLAHPAFRLGGATRRGLGRLSVVSVFEGRFDLADADERRRYLGLSRALGDCTGLERSRSLPVADAPGWERVALEWRPEGPWRIGGENSAAPLPQGCAAPKVEKDVDLQPLREPCVVWKERVPHLHWRWVVPAAGLKGALAHRATYHANRLAGRWAEGGAAVNVEDCIELQALFGFVQARKAKDGEAQARAGSVLFDDLFIDAPLGLVENSHTSLDRWMGGVMHGALFDEANLLPPDAPLRFELWLRRSIDAPARRALECAIDDWLEGRLNLGAGGSRGLGFGRGQRQVAAAAAGRQP